MTIPPPLLEAMASVINDRTVIDLDCGGVANGKEVAAAALSAAARAGYVLVERSLLIRAIGHCHDCGIMDRINYSDHESSAEAAKCADELRQAAGDGATT